MSSNQRWETRPLEFWPKMIELSLKKQQEAARAKEQGKKIGIGWYKWITSIFAGFEDSVSYREVSWLGGLASGREEHLRNVEATSAQGYPDAICSGFMSVCGSMFSGNPLWVKEGEADFALQQCYCLAMTKTVQTVSNRLGIPMFVVDTPVVAPEGRRRFHDDYFVAQLQDAIEWIEKLTGARCDDEKLIQGVRDQWETHVLIAKLCEFQKAIPAPLNLVKLFVLQNACRPKYPVNEETRQFMRMVYDEMKYRVDNRIADLATERRRLLHEGWDINYFNRHLMGEAARYGAVFVGGAPFFGIAAYERKSDGSWQVVPTPAERGIELQTREDALYSLAELNGYLPFVREGVVGLKAEDVLKRVADWHIDGVVFHYDHACQHVTPGLQEAKLAVEKRGTPTMIFEAAHSDPRQLDRANVLSILESFLKEVMGLNPLQPDRPKDYPMESRREVMFSLGEHGGVD